MNRLHDTADHRSVRSQAAGRYINRIDERTGERSSLVRVTEWSSVKFFAARGIASSDHSSLSGRTLEVDKYTCMSKGVPC